MHGIASPLTNRFLSVTGIQTLDFKRRRHGWLFLKIAGLCYSSFWLKRNSKEVLFRSMCLWAIKTVVSLRAGDIVNEQHSRKL